MSERVPFDSEKLSDSITAIFVALEEAFAPIIVAVQELAVSIVDTYTKAYAPFIRALEIFNTLQHPKRREDESLVDWYDRLERASLIDKYEYKLMYGKECWRSVLHSPVWVVGMAWVKVRSLWTKMN